MNAPKADANKSIADVEKTAMSLSGILTGQVLLVPVGLRNCLVVDSGASGYVQCRL